MSTNPTLDLDRLEAEHFLCPDCDRFAKHMPHCNECGDPFPCRVLALVAKARRLEKLEAENVLAREVIEACAKTIWNDTDHDAAEKATMKWSKPGLCTRHGMDRLYRARRSAMSAAGAEAVSRWIQRRHRAQLPWRNRSLCGQTGWGWALGHSERRSD